MSASTALLVAGHLLVLPFTLWVPGFLRLWRRREPAVLGAVLLGAAFVVAGWALRGRTGAVVWNATWPVVLGAAYAREGRKRAAHRPG